MFRAADIGTATKRSGAADTGNEGIDAGDNGADDIRG